MKRMVRVLFVVASSKHAFILKMIEHFSCEVESMVVVPSYPYTSTRSRQGMMIEKVSGVLFGGGEVLEAIAKFKPTAIYSDSPLYGSQSKILQRIAKQRIPTIVHLRGDLWREFFGWFQRSRPKAKLLGSAVYFNGMLGLLLADTITPICRWLEGEVLRHLPWKTTEVVYQGVDPTVFFPDPGVGLGLEHPAAVIIQNHSVYQKTLGLLQFREVVARLPSVRFYIATGEDMVQRYLPLVRNAYSGLENVHFIAGIGHPSGVRSLLAASDLYVLPSCLDCCPTTILEASLMEKPVLGSRVGGIPEIIRDGYTGWSIDNNNTEDWVNKIRMIVDDTGLSRRLGTQGRQWVCKNFAWPRIASQVERILKEVET